MKIIIYSTFPSTPHLETDLEIALLHLEKGDEVHFLCCSGTLQSCLYNPRHNPILCVMCRSRYKQAFTQLNIPRTNIHYFYFAKTDLSLPTWELSSVSDIKKIVHQDSDIGMAVASTLISWHRNHDFDVHKNLKLVESALKTAILVHSAASEILSRINPDLVYLFNGRFFTHKPLMRLCQRNNIAFKTHERAGSIYRYSTFYNVICHDLAYNKGSIEQLWSTAEDNRYEIGAQFFIDRRNRVMQSWEVFTSKQKRSRLPEQFDPSRKNITIFTSSLEEFEAIEGYDNPLYANDIDALSRILQSLSANGSTVYVRAHPNLSGLNNSQNMQTKEICSHYPMVRYIQPEESIDSYALLDASDKVITFGSTIGVEACYWGKPSILAGRSFYENLNCCYVPKTHEELVSLTHAELAPKDKTAAIKYGYWELCKGTEFKYFKPDGLFSGTFLNKRSPLPFFLRVMQYLDERSGLNW